MPTQKCRLLSLGLAVGVQGFTLGAHFLFDTSILVLAMQSLVLAVLPNAKLQREWFRALA